MNMTRPGFTLQGLMIAIACAALSLGVAAEWGRQARVRPRPGYDRARAVLAMRSSGRTSGGRGGGDFSLVIGVAAAAFAARHLRRRRPKCPQLR